MGKNVWTDYTLRASFDLLSGGLRYDREQGLIPDSSVQGPDWVVVTDGRFRHGTKLIRFRPDKSPRQCTMEQLQQ